MQLPQTQLVLILLSFTTLSYPLTASADCADPGECFCRPVEDAAALHVRVVSKSGSELHPRLTLEVIERLREDDTQPTPDRFEAQLNPFTCGVETSAPVGGELLAFVRQVPPCDSGDTSCAASAESPAFEVATLAWGSTFMPDDTHSFDVADVASLSERSQCQRLFSDGATRCNDTYEEGCAVGGLANSSLSLWIALGSLAWIRRRR